MADKRARATGKGKDHSFVGIPHFILRSDEFGQLDGNEVKLLLELAKEYKGSNNGDFSAAWSVMKTRGWRSSGTVQAAKDGLLRKGWLICTRHGGSHRCSLYGITWWSLDECGGKSLYKAETKARHEWRKNDLGTRYSDRSASHTECTDGKEAA